MPKDRQPSHRKIEAISRLINIADPDDYVHIRTGIRNSKLPNKEKTKVCEMLARLYLKRIEAVIKGKNPYQIRNPKLTRITQKIWGWTVV